MSGRPPQVGILDKVTGVRRYLVHLHRHEYGVCPDPSLK